MTSPAVTSVRTLTWKYNESSSIDSHVNIKTSGTGSAYAYACQAATVSWQSANTEFYSTRVVSTIPTYVSSSLVTQYFWDIWTTDCDSIPHVRGTKATSITSFWNTSTWTNYDSVSQDEYTGASPTCVIQPTDCASLLKSFKSENSAFSAWSSSSVTPPAIITGSPTSPDCDTSQCSATKSCTIQGDEVRLIYWPVTTTGANSCHLHGTTVPSNITGIVTAVALGTTFTSPSAYISFHELSAYNWECYSTIGKPLSDVIIAVDPKSLSSARGNHLGRSPYSFNLADLNGFVTSAAYFQMQNFDWAAARDTIFDDDYRPTIWLPEAVLSIRPEWSTCDLSIFGVPDPPIALQSAGLLTPEAPHSTSTPTALPAASATYTGPKASVTNTKPHGAGADPTKGNGSPQPSTSQNGQTDPSPHSQGGHTQGNGGDPPRSSAGAQSDPSSSSPQAIGDYIASLIGMGHSGSLNSDPNHGDPATSDPTSPSGNGGGDPSDPSAASIGSEGVVFASKTTPLSAFLASAQDGNGARYGLSTDASHSSYAMVDGSKVFVSGQATVIDGHTYSAASNGLIIDATTTIAFAANPTGADSSIQFYTTTDSSGDPIAVVDGTTLSVSGPAITVNGHTISEGSSGVVIDGSTITGHPSTDEISSLLASHSHTTSSTADSTAVETRTTSSGAALRWWLGRWEVLVLDAVLVSLLVL